MANDVSANLLETLKNYGALYNSNDKWTNDEWLRGEHSVKLDFDTSKPGVICVVDKGRSSSLWLDKLESLLVQSYIYPYPSASARNEHTVEIKLDKVTPENALAFKEKVAKAQSEAIETTLDRAFSRVAGIANDNPDQLANVFRKLSEFGGIEDPLIKPLKASEVEQLQHHGRLQFLEKSPTK